MTTNNGIYPKLNLDVKTTIVIHHSLSDEGKSTSFARYHVESKKWPGIAYHFVILKDGVIEWNHDLGVETYHVGDFNKEAIGVCLVGDYRKYEPTEAQKRSLRQLHNSLKLDLPNYVKTLGHNEIPGYTWKQCPCFDYRLVIEDKKQDVDVKRYRIMTETFKTMEDLVAAKQKLKKHYDWTLYEKADHLSFNPPYRIVTGTFISKEEAEKHAKQLKEKFNWGVYVLDA